MVYANRWAVSQEQQSLLKSPMPPRKNLSISTGGGENIDSDNGKQQPTNRKAASFREAPLTNKNVADSAYYRVSTSAAVTPTYNQPPLAGGGALSVSTTAIRNNRNFAHVDQIGRQMQTSTPARNTLVIGGGATKLIGAEEKVGGAFVNHVRNGTVEKSGSKDIAEATSGNNRRLSSDFNNAVHCKLTQKSSLS